jgi:uncharacterized protein (TIGR02246 family)
MKKALLALVASTSLLVTPSWADPLKEVAEAVAPRAKAYVTGDVEGWTAMFADNATFHSSLSPFRIDGKPAIRAYFAEYFAQYPNRKYVLRQNTLRAYGDNLVVANGYYELIQTDRSGKTTTSPGRYSVTFAKVDGRWQIVDQHNATLGNGP